MLEWLKGSKVDHPMADAKRARAIVDELPANDVVKALQEIAEWLDSIANTPGFSLNRRFEAVDMLDAAAKSRQRKLLQDYLAVTRQQKFREHQMWTAAYNCWKSLEHAYHVCIDQCTEGKPGRTAFSKSLPVVVSRAMRSLTLELKWTLLRYGTVEPRLWKELAGLYETAERGGFVDAVCAVYPGTHGTSSVGQEFLKAQMLSVSSTESLTPQRQEIAERLVAHFGPLFHLGGRNPARCNYSFDLAAGRAPVRVRQNVADTGTRRFFGSGEALGQLNGLVERAAKGGSLPENVHIGGQYGREIIRSVLGHLQTYWSDAIPARTSERRGTISRMTVLPGLDELLNTLDPSVTDTLDFSEHSAAESWIVDNVSDGGCGAIVPGQKGDWVGIGSLIGMRRETERNWGVGLIRRVSRDEHQQRRVGVQTITRTVIPVSIAHQGMTGERLPAVLLDAKPDRAGEIGLITRAGVYNSRDSLEMATGGKSFLLIPSKMVEGGEDFDWAKFKVMQKTA